MARAVQGPEPQPRYIALCAWAKRHRARVEARVEDAGVVVVLIHDGSAYACADTALMDSVDAQAASIVAQLQGAGWWR